MPGETNLIEHKNPSKFGNGRQDKMRLGSRTRDKMRLGSGTLDGIAEEIIKINWSKTTFFCDGFPCNS